jgi:hypothetical protein
MSPHSWCIARRAEERRDGLVPPTWQQDALPRAARPRNNPLV